VLRARINELKNPMVVEPKILFTSTREVLQEKCDLKIEVQIKMHAHPEKPV